MLFISKTVDGQSKIIFDWDTFKVNTNGNQIELNWLRDSISAYDREKVIKLVTSLSQPSSAQMLPHYFYIDGSFLNKTSKTFIDSISIRPPDGELGIIRVAYLVSKFRTKIISQRRLNKFYADRFNDSKIELPEYENNLINKNIELSFDYEPADLIIDIISNNKISYDEIFYKINLNQFEKLISHHNQGFYDYPLTKEQLARCLLVASSDEPLDRLYRYVNPDGLLYFTDVKDNLSAYIKLLHNLRENEKSVLNYINSSIASFLPHNIKFKRKISFFFINGSDGWSESDIAGVDLNYFKDEYAKFLRILVHETYHSGQNAIQIPKNSIRRDNVVVFKETIDYLFNEGTATFVSPPIVKTNEEKIESVKIGKMLIEDYFQNTIVNYNSINAEAIFNNGIKGAGPFYWLGCEMSRVIVEEFGKQKLANSIPNNGLTFFKTYFKAVKMSKKKTKTYLINHSQIIF